MSTGENHAGYKTSRRFFFPAALGIQAFVRYGISCSTRAPVRAGLNGKIYLDLMDKFAVLNVPLNRSLYSLGKRDLRPPP
jgi:hypothetical protein